MLFSIESIVTHQQEMSCIIYCNIQINKRKTQTSKLLVSIW